MDLINEQVEHANKYGLGKIVKQDDDFVFVKFNDDIEIRKFSYPDSIGTFLKLVGSNNILGLDINLPNVSNKEQFRTWLNDGNAKMFSPKDIVLCLDKVSKYAYSRKISHTDFWEIQNHSFFYAIYRKILRTNIKRSIDRITHKIFPIAGSLYAEFLKSNEDEKASIFKDTEKESSDSTGVAEESSLPIIIDKEDVVAWLTTQYSANGNIFSENVARQYMSSVRNDPLKLDLALSEEERNVFSCHTVEKFDKLYGVFHTAPNYQEVNRNLTHGRFAAGLRAYRGYLVYLSNIISNNSRILDTDKKAAQLMQHTTSSNQNGDELFVVNFMATQKYSGTTPYSCSIDGDEVNFNGNWRDLLAAIAEFFINNNNSKMEELKSKWISHHSDNSFLLSDKPPFAGKRLYNGYWINVNYRISELIRIIAGLCRYCEVNLDEVVITYKNKQTQRESGDSGNNEFSKPTVPNQIIEALRNDYANGFRFDATTLHLLSNKSGREIDSYLKSELKEMLFNRGDDVYFLLDVVACDEIRNSIVKHAETLLIDFSFFEISHLYHNYRDQLNPKCIANEESFEAFFSFISNRDDIRIVAVPHIGNKIVRYRNANAWDTLKDVSRKILDIVSEFGGTITEEELHESIPAVSQSLLAKIIKHCAEELITTEINGIVVYQTLESLGLTDDFSAVLFETLETLATLNLLPSEDNLHTALSLALGVNFKSECNIPDQETYRRLISAYYKAEPHRKWKKGVFSEVSA